MNLKKFYFLPIFLFAIGLILIVGIDFLLREFHGTHNSLGLSESLWFSLQIIVAIMTGLVFWKTSSKLNTRSRLLLFALVLFSSLILYALIVYGYVIETGVDGF